MGKNLIVKQYADRHDICGVLCLAPDPSHPRITKLRPLQCEVNLVHGTVRRAIPAPRGRAAGHWDLPRSCFLTLS